MGGYPPVRPHIGGPLTQLFSEIVRSSNYSERGTRQDPYLFAVSHICAPKAFNTL